MTTNGTLLEGERARYLVEHNFDISISLDGSQKEHDACRKFPEGSGSFELVIKRVDEMFKLYPGYTKTKVKFFTTVNPYMDLSCALNYFDSSELVDRGHYAGIEDISNCISGIWDIEQHALQQSKYSDWLRNYKSAFKNAKN